MYLVQGIRNGLSIGPSELTKLCALPKPIARIISFRCERRNHSRDDSIVESVGVEILI